MITPGVYFITGKLGSGKSAFGVSQIFDFLSRGRQVASNLDLKFTDKHYMHGLHNNFYRLPDKPNSADLTALGKAYEGEYQEKLSGLIVLDECASWFNSRTWNDPDRQALIEWIIHARKYGWVVFFLVQSFDVVDKQARELVGEYVVHCYNSNKLPITRLIPYKWHIASIYYQMHGNEVRTQVVNYSAKRFYSLYDTRQVFSSFYNRATFKYDTPQHLIGKTIGKPDWVKFARVWWFRWVPAIAGGCSWVPTVDER